MPRLRLLSGAIVAALVFSAAAQAGTTDFNKVVVFGDSLSDNGNLSLASGATQPSRFTTNPGEVAVEHIADYYGITLQPSLAGGTDYAFGGAGVLNNAPGTPAGIPTITTQVGAYINAAGMDGHTLYTMWGGANDIFYHATQTALAAETSDQAQLGVAATAQQELKLIGQMHAAGANYVVVFNLPDIGKTPSAAAQGAAAAQGLSGLSLIYNGVLSSGLNTLSGQGLNVVPVDVYGLFNEVIANPSAFGFSNVTDPACGAGSSSVQCGPQGSGAPYTYAPGSEQSYLFADGVHPTTAAHKMLGQYVIAELQAPGQISMLAEAPLAASNAHLGILRNQMLMDNDGAPTRAFAGISYAKQRFDATGDSPKTDSNNLNLTLGVDAATGDHFNVGVALGLARNNADVGAGGFKLDSIMGTGYALWHRDNSYLGANVGFAQLSYNDINRRFQLGALQRTESGQTDGNQIMAGINGGFWFGSSAMQIGPYARLQWQRIRVDGYTESGNDSSAMWFAHQQRDSLIGTLGVHLKGNWKAGNGMLHPYLDVALNRDDRADPRKVRAGLSGMQGSFALTGFTPDNDWISAELGLAADFSDSVSGWVAYQGRFADSNERLNSLQVGIKIAM